jgi:GTP-binding protein
MTQFIDYAEIDIASGDGGNGVIAWRREKYEPLGGPAGGGGGHGGDIYIEASNHLSTLSEFKYRKEFIAQNGERGGSSRKDGKQGKDLTIKVPIGTVIKDAESNNVIADLDMDGDRVLVAGGGRGGRGNSAFATPTSRAPHYCEPGEPGIKRHLILELKLLADIGLIGLPNAGKSTLLAAVTRAKPKIADYPFSTLEPNLGTVKTEDGQSFVIADIPGLISGASRGAGLGHDFLRHIERTVLLVHLVDATSENLVEDIQIIEKELKDFHNDLSNKEQILVLNKIDLLPAEKIDELKQKLQKQFLNRTVITLSGLAQLGIQELMTMLKHRISQIRNSNQQTSIESEVSQSEKSGRTWTADDKATQRLDNGFEVTKHKGDFYIDGSRILRHAQVVDYRSPESIQHFCHILRSMGVIDELYKQNIQPGDEIHIGQRTFIFGENLY